MWRSPFLILCTKNCDDRYISNPGIYMKLLSKLNILYPGYGCIISLSNRTIWVEFKGSLL